jgi:hypothetical protein
MASARGSRPASRAICARASLRLVWGVQVFQALLSVGGAQLGFEFGSQLALLGNGFKNGGAPVFQLAHIAQANLQVAQHCVVQPAGSLLSIARDEWHGGAVVQQFDRGGDLRGAHV